MSSARSAGASFSICAVSLTSSTDYATTFYTYDSYGRTATVQQKHWDGASTRTLSTVTYTYETSGPDNGLLLEVETVTPLDTHTVEYTYDSKGRAIGVETKDDTVDYDFDGFGNTVFAASDDLITTYTWSTSGGSYFMPPRLLNVADSAGQDTDYAYTIYNKVYTVTDALSQVTTFTYDNQGNTKTVAAPSQGAVTYIYDIYGHLVQLTDANSNVTKYRYDEFGRQVLESAMNGGSPLYEIGYDYGLSGGGCGSCGTGGGEEQLLHRFIGNGSTTDSLYFNYDFAGRMVGMGIDADADDVIYAYDSNRRLTSITHANGSALWGNNLLGYAYDARGRVVKETYPNGRTIEFSYDSTDRVTSIKDPFGFITQIGYDADSRPETYTHSSLGTAQIAYDADDRMTQIELGSAAYSQFNYDAHGRLEEIINRATITKVNGVAFYGKELYIDDIIVSASKLERLKFSRVPPFIRTSMMTTPHLPFEFRPFPNLTPCLRGSVVNVSSRIVCLPRIFHASSPNLTDLPSRSDP